jgi:hypothetical protein
MRSNLSEYKKGTLFYLHITSGLLLSILRPHIKKSEKNENTKKNEKILEENQENI